MFVRVMRWESRGFLGLDLLRPEVATIRKWFKEHHASVLLVPVAYRQPRVTVEEAYPIAEQFLRQKQSRRYSTLTWGPIVRAAHAGEACAWAFFSGSHELQRQGYVPGGLFACVDKLEATYGPTRTTTAETLSTTHHKQRCADSHLPTSASGLAGTQSDSGT